MTAVLKNELLALMDQAGVEPGLPATSQPFRKWCIDQGVTSVELYASLANDIGQADANIVKKAKASVTTLFGTVGEEAQVKWLWHLCKSAVDRGDLGRTDPDDGKAMSAPQQDAISQAWKKHYNFTLSGFRLLTPVLLAKLYRHATASPKMFVILYPEELKLRNSMAKTESTSVSLKPGELPSSVVQDLEVVTGIAVFRDKVEALLNTWAYVSIQDTVANPKDPWFSYQDVHNIMDKLNEKFRLRYRGGARPPLSFYTKVFIQTMHYISDQVGNNDRKLGETLRDFSSWLNMWSGWEAPIPSGTQGNQGQTSVEDRNTQLPRQVRVQMNQLSQMARGVASALQRSRQMVPAYDNTYFKGSGKRGGKGKGQGNRYQPYGGGSVWQDPFPPAAAGAVGGKGGKKGGKGGKGGKKGGKGGKKGGKG